MGIKICHMTSVHPWNDVRIFFKECRSLAKAGYEIYLVAEGTNRYEEGVHIVGCGEQPVSRKERMRGFARKVYEKAVELDCDIYHLHDPELLPYGLKLKKIGKKVIFDSHEDYVKQIREKQYLPQLLRSFISLVYEKYETYVLGKIDAVIFPCFENYNSRLKNKCKRYVLLNNFPFLNELYDKYNENELKEQNSLCYIGSLTYNRGVTHLVKALEYCDCTLFLAGTFSPSSYETEVRKLNGFAKVKYLGYIDRECLKETIKRSQVGIAALLNIGQYKEAGNLSTKVYEYLSLGVPVILHRNDLNQSVINQYHFGLCVDPENTEEYAATINKLLKDKDLRKQMGEAGRQAVREVFNWDIQVKNLLSLYEDLVREINQEKRGSC